jgi:hypothetical protein
VLASCGSAPPPLPSPSVFAFLADGRLVAIDPSHPAIDREVRLTATDDDAAVHLLALDPGRHRLALLSPSTVTIVDARTLVPRAARPLPDGLRYRTLAVEPATGDVLAFGDRAEDGGRSPWLTRVTADGAVAGSWRLRPSGGRTWAPYAAAAGDGLAVVSYHGPDTTGADVVRLDDPGRPRCPPSGGLGCLPEVHGAVGGSGRPPATATPSSPSTRRSPARPAAIPACPAIT